MTDIAGDGFDQNCDGVDGQDSDGDGEASLATGGIDCDDNDVSITSQSDVCLGTDIEEESEALLGENWITEPLQLQYICDNYDRIYGDIGLDVRDWDLSTPVDISCLTEVSGYVQIYAKGHTVLMNNLTNVGSLFLSETGSFEAPVLTTVENQLSMSSCVGNWDMEQEPSDEGGVSSYSFEMISCDYPSQSFDFSSLSFADGIAISGALTNIDMDTMFPQISDVRSLNITYSNATQITGFNHISHIENVQIAETKISTVDILQSAQIHSLYIENNEDLPTIATCDIVGRSEIIPCKPTMDQILFVPVTMTMMAIALIQEIVMIMIRVLLRKRHRPVSPILDE